MELEDYCVGASGCRRQIQSGTPRISFAPSGGVCVIFMVRGTISHSAVYRSSGLGVPNF
jgi:hypothetical protein